MNKKKMIVDKYNTVYSFDIYVVLNPYKDGLDKLFKWAESDNIKSEENDINTFSDEVVHITMEVLNACDMQYSEDSCEAYAYLQGYITECIYKTAKKEWAS